MLKALELVGFKSFADKTRFEFPPGITVVVGPNGSGKSNIVDAVKWVLGEQRVKSLRGTEMADVIFNGSGSRRGLNSAEVTLTFENSDNQLPIDTPEVHITRRVYRSGEGEYLINRQPCRLRDIRDLLSGTGLGTQAYSVIEQGKVDVLLQSSPRERRVIFEEAAGISRFKAKRIEAERRLERVEQNLLRLSDIVDEVESRLRSVRSQAGKARRYKEHTDRLQELRTQVGLVDWSRLTEKLSGFESQLDTFTTERDGAIAQAESIEATLLEAETTIGDVNEEIRRGEALIAANRERIAGQESTIDHERSRTRDLEAETDRHRQQLSAMSARAGDLQDELRQTAEDVQAADEHHGQITRLVTEEERVLTDLINRLDQLREENEQRRGTYMEQMRSCAALGNEISRLTSQVEATEAACRRNQQRIGQLDGQLGTLDAELETLNGQRDDASTQVDKQGTRLTEAKDRLADRTEQSEQSQAELARLEQRRSVLAERASILDELERRQEGLSPGVKEVLARAKSPTAGPLRHVEGMVADLLHVGVEAAMLVEVALGERAQHLVAAPDKELLDYLIGQTPRFAGRVGFVWSGRGLKSQTLPEIDLEGQPGVVARADKFIQADAKYMPLAARLLDRTWVVENIEAALALAESNGRSLSFVTLKGELLGPDGSLSMGLVSHASTGLISRRSELRALKGQIGELESKVRDVESVVKRLAEEIAREKGQVQTLSAQHQQTVESLRQIDHKIIASDERKTQLDRQRKVLAAEYEAASSEHDSAAKELDDARLSHGETEASLAEMETNLTALGEQIDLLETEHQAGNRRTTETKVELAKSEERLGNLRTRMRQFEESQQERQRAITESRQQLAQCTRRGAQSRRNILNAESEVAVLYLRKEAYSAQTVQSINRREAIIQERSELTAEVHEIRARIHKLEEKIHSQQLAAGEVRHQRNSLSDRLREDYGIELSELEHEPNDEEQHQREEVQQEIDDLRRKINNLGNVNLEALEELEDLDSRHSTLSEQYKDLADAKASLERIIDRINTDSRRLFVETLETVKGHFQSLFRDLFGGGRADIILDEGADILETGIEIVARPPGKEPRSISLLSGGEKTLTCVALLLAIFRSRPSPFCVLDEVDAALDEANIDRFIKVMRDFLTWTQFIIVTHSKKTMTCASTIYGVTMQESGVSKQVSVRFEDVSEEGEILTAPGRTADPPPAAEDDETQAA